MAKIQDIMNLDIKDVTRIILDNKIKTAIICFCLFMTVSIINHLIYAGININVKVRQKELGPYKLLYESHRGPYFKLRSDFTAEGIEMPMVAACKPMFEEYQLYYHQYFAIVFDDPKNTPKEKLRGVAGCVINEDYYENRVKYSFDDIEQKYKILDYPKVNSLYVEFPLRKDLWNKTIKNIPHILAAINKSTAALRNAFKKEQNTHILPMVLEIIDFRNEKYIYIIPFEPIEDELLNQIEEF